MGLNYFPVRKHVSHVCHFVLSLYLIITNLLVYFTAYIELGNQYEVLNKAGQPIFFAIDATEWQGMVFDGAPFNLMLLDYDYVEICKIDGQPGQAGRVKGVSRENAFYFQL